jgi:serine/threonine-protein kinase
MSAPALEVDQLVSSTYKIVRRVGAGGMGEIYEATHARLAGRYALKLLRSDIATTSEAYARFQREARVTSALRHPNIVQVIDFSQIDGGGAPFLVMEFLDGPELAQVMKRAGGPLPLAQVLSYVKQIAAGLMAAHQSEIVHRDLKPQNIFVLKVVGHDDELVKIVDFGISKVNDVTTTITSSHSVMGTAHYMSPEQARGLVEEIDARTDQFSLAIIVYEMLTGEDAFRGDSVSSIVYQIVHEEPRRLVGEGGPIAPAVASVLRRALSKTKERRFPTIVAFANALEAAATADVAELGRTVSKKIEVAATETSKMPRRRALWIAAGAALIASGAALAMRSTSSRPGEPSASATVSTPAPVAPVGSAPPIAPPVATPPTPAAAARPSPPAPPPLRVEAEQKANVVRRRAKPQSAVKPTSPAPVAAPRPDCNPNYYLGPAGEKHFKTECFVNPQSNP